MSKLTDRVGGALLGASAMVMSAQATAGEKATWDFQNCTKDRIEFTLGKKVDDKVSCNFTTKQEIEMYHDILGKLQRTNIVKKEEAAFQIVHGKREFIDNTLNYLIKEEGIEIGDDYKDYVSELELLYIELLDKFLFERDRESMLQLLQFSTKMVQYISVNYK